MNEEKLRHLNNLDYELRHAEKDRQMLLFLIKSPKDLKTYLEDGVHLDDDLISDMLSSQLMRVIARQGEAQKEWDSL